MDTCPIIEIFPATVTNFADSNGRVLLDVSDVTRLPLDRELYDDDGVFYVSGDKEFSLVLPPTAKNFFYLKTLFDPNTDKTNNTSIVTRITVGSSTLPNALLHGIRKSSDQIEVHFKLEEYWKDILNRTKLSDLDLGQFDLLRDNVIDNWENNQSYVDGDPGHYFQPVFYGSWLSYTKIMTPEDLRPFFHALYLMQKMFEHIGWCFNSPYYETSFGRRLICYLNDQQYGNDEVIRRSRVAVASKILPFGHFNDEVTDWTEQVDEGENFDPVIGRYENSGTGKFVVSFVFGRKEFTNEDHAKEIEVRLIKHNLLNSPGQPGQEIIHTETVPVIELSVYKFEVETHLTPGQSIALRLVYNIVPLVIKTTVTMSYNPTRSIYSEGDTIVMNKAIDQKMTCLELLSGYQHIIKGIFSTDYTAKKVTLYTPHDADVYGESITGYYNNNLVSLRQKQIENTAVSVVSYVSQERYITLAFKASSDAKTKNKTRADGTIIYSKSIDLGNHYQDKILPDRNPVFEPTEIDSVVVLGRQPPTAPGEDIIDYTMFLPIMTDNDDSRVSYQIEPRILYIEGYEIPGLYPTEQQSYAFGVKGVYLEKLSFAFQDAYDIEFNGAVSDKKVVYGNDANDFWTKIIGRFYTNYKSGIKIDFLHQLSLNLFFYLSLRDKYEIEYDGHPVAGRILRINGFEPCLGLSTPIFLMPDMTTDNYCLDSTPDADCDNNFTIIVQLTGTCYTFSISGNFDCNVVSILWEVKRPGEDWEEIPGSENTATLCDEGALFIVRATVLFDCEECPIVIRTKTIDPCRFNTSCLLTVYTNEFGSQCLQVDWTQVNLPPYTVLVEYSLDEENWTELDDPYILCDLDPDTIYYVRLSFDIIGSSCDTIVLTCQINSDGQTCDNFPILLCVPVDVNGVICYEFAIGGSMSSELLYFVVSGECDGEEFTWMMGDDPICCAGTLTAKAMVHFCGCPAVCTDVASCEGTGCTMFEPGTAIQLVVCN